MEDWLTRRIELIKSRLSKHFTKEDCNVVAHDSADVADILKKSGLGKKKFRIATSGYSFEQEGFADITLRFLKYLDKYLKSKNTGYITSPTLYPGSIYDITTAISGLKQSDVAFFTTDRYWEGTHLDNFNLNVNMRKFLKAPIHVFPDNQTYLEATANASNVLICTGGRKVAINEIVEALKRNHRVIMLVNNNLKNKDFDEHNNSVECAPKYFNNYIQNQLEDPANIKDFDLKYLKENEGKILQLVKWYFVDNSDESIKGAAYRAAHAIEGPTIYDLIEKYHTNEGEKARLSKMFNTQVGEAYVLGKSHFID